jgi:hypothetical protein
MKHFLILWFLLLTLGAFSQTPPKIVHRSSSAVTVSDARLRGELNLYIPTVCDTLTALNGGLDSVGAIIFDKCNHIFYLRDTLNGGHYWKPIISGTNSTPSSQESFKMNFVGTNVDSINNLTIIPVDGSTTIFKDSVGLHLQRTNNTTNVWNNRIIITPYGQTWTNTFLNTIEVIPNFNPSSTTRSIAIGTSVTGDNQIATAINYFGFSLKLGNDPTTSGFQGISSNAGSVYSKRFFTGLIWKKGDIIKLSVEGKDRNKFLVIVTNINNGSTVSGYLNFPLGSTANANWYTIDSGYPSIFFDGGDFTVTKYSFDPLVSGVQLVWISTSIGYGYSLDSAGINNNFYTYYNIIKDQIPVKSVLMAKSGSTTLDVQHAMREILTYKPRYAVIDGIQTNDYFVYGFGTDTITTRANYTAIVDKLKANGINVIHVVPMPRGTRDALYKKFQLYQKNWILRTFPNDIIVNDFDALLAPDSLNTLNPLYYTYGDGTHPNVAGHAIRANAFLNTVQFDYYKGSTLRTNTDTAVIKIATIGTNNAPANGFALEVLGATKTDSLIGGTDASDSIYFTTTRNATKGKFLFGQNFQIHEASGFTGIGNFTTAQNALTQLHVKNKSSSTVEIRVENDSTRSGAAARFGLQNDIGDFAQIYLGSSINAFTPRILNINNGNGIDLSTSTAIYFGNNAIAVSPWTNVLATFSTVTGNFGIGQALVSPTARLHISNSPGTAGTAPIKLTAGTNLTIPEDGAVEYDGTNFYATVATTRYTIGKGLAGSATLDFPSTNTQTSSDLTITVTGAADGDIVELGVPNSSTNANSSFTAWCSGTNTVTVRFNNYSTGAIDPTSGTFKVRVIK